MILYPTLVHWFEVQTDWCFKWSMTCCWSDIENVFWCDFPCIWIFSMFVIFVSTSPDFLINIVFSSSWNPLVYMGVSLLASSMYHVGGIVWTSNVVELLWSLEPYIMSICFLNLLQSLMLGYGYGSRIEIARWWI